VEKICLNVKMHGTLGSKTVAISSGKYFYFMIDKEEGTKIDFFLEYNIWFGLNTD